MDTLLHGKIGRILGKELIRNGYKKLAQVNNVETLKPCIGIV